MNASNSSTAHFWREPECLLAETVPQLTWWQQRCHGRLMRCAQRTAKAGAAHHEWHNGALQRQAPHTTTGTIRWARIVVTSTTPLALARLCCQQEAFKASTEMDSKTVFWAVIMILGVRAWH